MKNINEEKIQKDIKYLTEKTRSEDIFKLANARNKALEQSQVNWAQSYLIWAAASIALLAVVTIANVNLTDPINSNVTNDKSETFLAIEAQDNEYYDDFYYWLDIYDDSLVAITE